MLEIYDILSALGKQEYDNDMAEAIQYYKQELADYGQKYKMKRLSYRGAKPPTDGRENRGSDDRGIGGGEDTTEQFESHGYTVIPDYFEDESGRWETLIKVRCICRKLLRSGFNCFTAATPYSYSA